MPAKGMAYTNTNDNTFIDGEVNAGHHFNTDTFFNVACPTPLTSLSILGTLIHAHGNAEALANVKETTKKLINKTANTGSHAALFFLFRYAAVPKVMYLLRAAPAYMAEAFLWVINKLV